MGRGTAGSWDAKSGGWLWVWHGGSKDLAKFTLLLSLSLPRESTDKALAFCNYYLQSRLHVRETGLPGPGRYHKSVYGVLCFSSFLGQGIGRGGLNRVSLGSPSWP